MKTALFLFFFLFSTLIAEGPPAPPSKETVTPSLPNPFEGVLDEHSRGNEDHFISDFINMMVSLGLIIILIFIVSWLLKRFLNTRIQQVNTTSAIKILERRALTPKTAIYLLEINSRSVVISESTNGVTLLSLGSSRQSDFSEILKDEQIHSS